MRFGDAKSFAAKLVQEAELQSKRRWRSRGLGLRGGLLTLRAFQELVRCHPDVPLDLQHGNHTHA